jgi:2'-5' RNA ligase
MWRLFVAIPLPDPVKDEIQKAQDELRRALPENCFRWTKRAQFHLTLKFLGNVEAKRVGVLSEALRGACGKFPALSLKAERIGCFPDLRYPRVIWAWVHDEGERLPKLQEAIEAATAEFTSEKPEGKFTGHVTLGRSHGIKRAQAEILAKLANEMVKRCFGDWTADKVELIRSELASNGARYTTVAAIPLAAGRIFNHGLRGLHG